jgi:hypothetical protein
MIVTDAASDAPPAARRVISQRREFAIIVVLSLLAVSMIAVASATNSYVPLFVAWVPYLAIPLLVSRLDRARAAASPPPPIGRPVRTETDETDGSSEVAATDEPDATGDPNGSDFDGREDR